MSRCFTTRYHFQRWCLVIKNLAMASERLIQFITFTFCKMIPQNRIDFVSYPKSLLPKAPAKKQGNFIMASELKINDLHHVAKKSHSCKQCGYSCDRPSMLKRNIWVHNREKPFVDRATTLATKLVTIAKGLGKNWKLFHDKRVLHIVRLT